MVNLFILIFFITILIPTIFETSFVISMKYMKELFRIFTNSCDIAASLKVDKIIKRITKSNNRKMLSYVLPP